MILTVSTIDEFIKQARRLTIREIGICQSYKSQAILSRKGTRYQHFAMIEVSGFAGYEVHHVALAEVLLETSMESAIPNELVTLVDAASVEMAKMLKNSLDGDIIIVEGLFGASQVDQVFEAYYKPLKESIMATNKISENDAAPTT